MEVADLMALACYREEGHCFVARCNCVASEEIVVVVGMVTTATLLCYWEKVAMLFTRPYLCLFVSSTNTMFQDSFYFTGLGYFWLYSVEGFQIMVQSSW